MHLYNKCSTFRYTIKIYIKKNIHKKSGLKRFNTCTIWPKIIQEYEIYIYKQEREQKPKGHQALLIKALTSNSTLIPNGKKVRSS